jgi:hypothetical protein
MSSGRCIEITSFCSAKINKESAQAFFRAVVADGRAPWPKKINIDGNKAPFEVGAALSEPLDSIGRLLQPFSWFELFGRLFQLCLTSSAL